MGIGFVLKSFVGAIALIMVLQMEVGGQKLEQRADTWLHSAKIAKFVQAVADGAIHLTQSGIEAAQKMIGADNGNNSKPAPQTQRASK